MLETENQPDDTTHEEEEVTGFRETKTEEEPEADILRPHLQEIADELLRQKDIMFSKNFLKEHRLSNSSDIVVASGRHVQVGLHISRKTDEIHLRIGPMRFSARADLPDIFGVTKDINESSKDITEEETEDILSITPQMLLLHFTTPTGAISAAEQPSPKPSDQALSSYRAPSNNDR